LVWIKNYLKSLIVNYTRRDFLKVTSASVAAIGVVPEVVIPGPMTTRKAGVEAPMIVTGITGRAPNNQRHFRNRSRPGYQRFYLGKGRKKMAAKIRSVRRRNGRF
jgi:hypothetical protein